MKYKGDTNIPKRISFILSLLLILFMSSIVIAGTIELPKTGQTTSYTTGDDGDLERGVAWSNPRFTDNSNGTVTDNLTGLMWSKNANLPDGYMTWQNALNYIASLNSGSGLADYHDWRLPNKKELQSLIDYSNHEPALPTGNPFTNVQSDYYWSSSTYADSTYYAWFVDMYDGYMYYNGKDGGYNYVWPVRAGQSGSFGHLVISVSPASGVQSGSFDVTITGTNFTGATEVSFGLGITVNSFNVDSDTQVTANITIYSSAVAGARDVSVTNADGTGKMLGGFVIKSPCGSDKPSITKLSKLKGKPGNVITITGKNFCDEGGEVLFGIKSAEVSVWSNQSISVKVPNIKVGKLGKTVLVKVKSSNGKISNVKAFKVLPTK